MIARLLTSVALFVALGALAVAQIPETEEEPLLEGMPDYMIQHVMPGALTPTSYETRAQYAWTDTAVLWEKGQKVTVCFLSGKPEALARIVAVANEWNTVGADISLDFGPLNNPRVCTGSAAVSDVRVSFSQPGYFSLNGRDSRTGVGEGLPSLNLQRFDYPSVSDKEFRRLILHEFGHALGLMHEQQRPDSGCDLEYDWDNKVYPRMTLEPPFWSTQMVDINMKQVKARGRIFSTPFDTSSIMLYAYPASFYRSRPNRCFTPGNTAISDGDKQVLRAMYADPKARQKRLALLGQAYMNTQDPDERETLEVYAMTFDEIGVVREQEARASAAAVYAWQAELRATAEVARVDFERANARYRAEYRAWAASDEVSSYYSARAIAVPPPHALTLPSAEAVSAVPDWFNQTESRSSLQDARRAAAERLMEAAREDVS